ncbi:UbiA prenyltransferase [Macrolepiota fuliginosa MF-IS2]|uniref:4-hydroxybenzoate polyprenyltransferase, mitochondrial n=1 Tax=Macrolepiota fuliginosa MF-IS2 TaxID=1400762 RepID=A0A9P5X8J1_9AGAR|nr:UbiA prenyltransferase [Macrolepiota fuliginosa MF-IS2]
MGRLDTENTPLLPQGDSQEPRPRFPLSLFPVTIRPYLELARIEKPTGFILMFWPFAWGLTMAAYRTQMPLRDYWWTMLHCLFGAIILRTSACTINDIFDRKLDAGVARTKRRPLPSGRISVFAASVYVMIQYIVGLVFFATTLEGLALWVAIFQLLPLFAIYPLMKRFTHWPQAWLGFAMNFGFITAWVATTGHADNELLGVAMAACWCWTMLYDTIYACQDIKDDIKMGAKSTAILFGSWIRPLLILIALSFVVLLSIVGVLNKQGWPFFSISVGGTATHVVWQFFTVDLNVPESCWRNFKRNGHLGWLLWAGLMIDYVLSSGSSH